MGIAHFCAIAALAAGSAWGAAIGPARAAPVEPAGTHGAREGAVFEAEPGRRDSITVAYDAGDAYPRDAYNEMRFTAAATTAVSPYAAGVDPRAAPSASSSTPPARMAVPAAPVPEPDRYLMLLTGLGLLLLRKRRRREEKIQA